MKSDRPRIATRALALVLCALLGPLSCVPAPLVAPASGVAEYRAYGLIPVPGGLVDAVGGNLVIRGVGTSLDTPLGTWGIEPVWNSASSSWQWGHLAYYDGDTFVDASGAVFDTTAVADGAFVPGTGWTRVDASSLRTRGGLLLHFGRDGRLEQARWATLDHPRIEFGVSQIRQCTAASACAPIFELELHASGQPTRVRDARTGREARFEYDADGRIVTARSPADVAQGRPGTRYEYAGGQLVARTTSEGARVEYAYQAGGRIRSVTQRGEGDPAHVFDFYGRNAWGMHRTVHRNPLGGHTTVYFDEQRRVLRVERFEAGENATLAWQGLYPTQLVDAGGAVTQLAWQDGRVATRVTPSGNAIHTTYAAGALSPDEPARDPVLRVEDSIGLVEARSYDAAGRPVAILNGTGDTRVLAWNEARLASLEQGGVTASFPDYGVHGHWLDTALGGSVVARRAFDLVGNETVPPDPERPGGALGFAFDADRHASGMQVAASDDAGRVAATATISFDPRSDGALSRIERPYGGDHELVRDALGRVVRIREKSEGRWRETRIEYDAQGAVTARELANGMRQEWDYDLFGRVVAHRALRSGALEGEETFTWRSGRLAARMDSLRDAGEVFVYDGAGRTVSVIFGYGETISYEFDQRDRVVREVYSIPGVGVVADLGTTYDGADRRVAIQDRATGAPLVAWRFEDGRLAEVDTGNGLHRTLAYDERGRLAGQETRSATGALVETTSIRREIASSPPRLEVRSATVTTVASTEERYWLPPGSSLASLDQRVGKRVFGWSDGSGPARRYAWDELGNRVATSTGDDFVYDAERTRLLFASLAGEGESHVYLYDDAGFAISRDGVPLRWTAAGRLASHGADAIAWDMAGRPLAVTESGVTREFRFFGGRVESEARALGALDLGDVVLALGSGARRWRHFDFRDQVSFVSDESGAIVAHYRYQPFGVDAGFGPEAGSGRFENRSAFGPFFLLGQRVLDPAVGRFLSPDPVLQPVSQYAYAYGNPIEFEDADGMHPETRVSSPGFILDTVRTIVTWSGVIVASALLDPLLVFPAAMMALATTIEYADEYYGQGPGIGGGLDGNPSGGGGGGGGGGSGGGGGGGSGSGCGCKLQLEIGIAGSPSVGGATGVGCAPLALTRGGDAPERMLLVLLMGNALVALAWWRRRRRGGFA